MLVEISKQRQGRQYARKILNFTYNGILKLWWCLACCLAIIGGSYTPVISRNYYHEDQRITVHPAGNLSRYFDGLRTVCASLKDLNF